MSAAGSLMAAPSTSQALGAQRSVAHTTCFWGRQRAPLRSGISGRASRRTLPQAFGRAGYWGGCTPGMMGGISMNRPMAEVLQQLEKEFNMAAQQQRQHPHHPDNNSGSSARRSNGMRLPVDTIETEDAIWYFADLPGLEKSELQIQANQQNRTLTISGERTQPTVGEDESKQTRNLQRLFGKFSHTISLPKDADPQLISAKVEQGVLRIKVLKETNIQPEMQNVPID